MSSKGGGSSSTHKESGIFYKRVSPNLFHYGDNTKTTFEDNLWKDTALNTTFPDLYDGSTETCSVAGGADEELYFSQCVVPETDNFGDSTLIGMKYFIYPTAVDQQQLNTYTPAYRLWNLNTPMGDEGAITPDKRDLAVFSTYMDIEKPLFGDDFSSLEKKYRTYRGSSQHGSGEPFITVDHAANYQDWTYNPLKMTKDEIFQKYGSMV